MKTPPLYLNISGFLMDLEVPKVMGILNITPDSFYSGSRVSERREIEERVKRMLEEGVDIIDIGGCSTRPGFSEPTEKEEAERVDMGCEVVREITPDIPLSVDTYRSSVALHSIEKWGIDIVNDISGGLDPEMWPMVADKKVAYVLTHNRQENNGYKNVTAEVITELSKSVNELHRLGVNDVIVDPGFGFAKSLDENFKLLNDLDLIKEIGLPLLVGISRKSMIYKTLNLTPEESLVGTIALNSIALEKGCDILRVHDVKAAKETVKLFAKLKGKTV